MNSHRTQLYLDERRYRFLVQKARRHRISVAEVVRQMIDRELEGQPEAWPDDPLFELVGLADGEARPVARHFEDELYGEEKQQ